MFTKKHFYTFIFLTLNGAFFLVSESALFAEVPTRDTAGSQDARFREKYNEPYSSEKEEPSASVIEEAAVEPPAAPKSTSTVRIPVKEVSFIGNYSIPDAELRPLVQDLVGRDVTLDEIQDAVTKVKRYYREHKYIATYAYVPPQEIEDGIVKIDIIEGRLGELRIEGNQHYSEEILRRQFSLRQGEVLTYDKLRRDLERLKKLEDVMAKVSLQAGKEMGTADAVVTIEDRSPVHATILADNSGTKNTGLYHLGGTLRHHNVTGQADALSSTVQFSEGTNAAGIGYNRPVFDGLTTLGYSFTYGNVDIGGDFDPLGAEGVATTHSLTASRPLWQGPSMSVEGTAGFDVKDVKNKLLGEKSGVDNLRIAWLSGLFTHSGEGTKTLLSPGLYFGIPGIIGGSDRVDAEATREGTGGEFFAARGQGVHYRELGKDILLSLRSTVQLSPDSLPPSEQFRIGGARTVRGYQESDTLADYGGHLSTELFFPMVLAPSDWLIPFSGKTVRDSVQFITFADVGTGSLHKPSAGEEKRRTLAGAGIGLRTHLYDKMYARLEWGFPFGDDPSDSRSSAYYFTVSYELL